MEEHKGGRIKDHVRQGQTEMKDDWLDDDWLDEDDTFSDWSDKKEDLHSQAAEAPNKDEALEIEDWRDEDNWNLDKKEDHVSSGESGSGSGKTGGGSSGKPGSQKKRRPTQQQGGTAAGTKKKKKPDRKEDSRNQKKGTAARSVKTAGKVAGKAGRTAGKAVGKGLSIAMKCGCFVVMAVIILELWQGFWAERSTLGEIWRVASDKNYAEGLYLGIAGVILLYGVISAIWLLGGKRMPDGNRLRSYDTGRGLTAFILFAILAVGSGVALPLMPDSPQLLDGARLALTVADRARTIVLGCSVIGIVLCIIRKILGR